MFGGDAGGGGAGDCEGGAVIKFLLMLIGVRPRRVSIALENQRSPEQLEAAFESAPGDPVFEATKEVIDAHITHWNNDLLAQSSADEKFRCSGGTEALLLLKVELLEKERRARARK
jgi:hypothetical protein